MAEVRGKAGVRLAFDLMVSMAMVFEVLELKPGCHISIVQTFHGHCCYRLRSSSSGTQKLKELAHIPSWSVVKGILLNRTIRDP